MKKLNLPINEIIDLYSSGYGSYKIAKQFNCSASSVNNLLKNNNIDTKKTSNDYRKYTLNENYFEHIDTEDKAYFLGLIYSDGNVYKSILKISLQESDSYILEQFLKYIQSTGHLYFLESREKNHKNQKIFSISNKTIIDDLKKLGVFEKKSLTLKFPTTEQVPKNLMNHFIRGVFDGDGSIFNTERIINGKTYYEPGVSIISSIGFIDGLFEFLGFGNVYKTNNNKFISFKGKVEIVKIINYIYNDATIFLNRKFDKSKVILYFLNKKKYFYSGEKIIQSDLNGNEIKIWDNIGEIKKLTNYNTQTILRNIKGKIKTSNNFIFKIYD